MTRYGQPAQRPPWQVPLWLCAFTHVDGTRAFKSTRRTKRKEAEEVARGWQRAVDLARRDELTEAQVHNLKAEICQWANGERVHFASVSDFLNGWIRSKELTTARGTANRYRGTVDLFLGHLGAKAKRSLSSITPRDVAAFRDATILASFLLWGGNMIANCKAKHMIFRNLCESRRKQ